MTAPTLGSTSIALTAAPVTSWRFAPGEAIVTGRRALALLGGGDRHEAWVAWDDRLHATVVAKLLRPNVVDDAAARAALAREADALATLVHPDLVRSFGAVLDGPRPHLVLELLDGPRLSTLVRRFGPLSAEQLVLLGRRLASVLACVHDAGWVHLDVKPRNIVMTSTPRLIDLSVARPAAAARGRTGVGTTAYMAPEACDPALAERLGPPADVWSLGATLHEAVTGRQAFAAAPGGPSYPQLHREAPPLPPSVPAVVADVIRRCLAPDPGARPLAEAIDAELEPLADWAIRSARRLR
jgi:serine/threonine protein kinase